MKNQGDIEANSPANGRDEGGCLDETISTLAQLAPGAHGTVSFISGANKLLRAKLHSMGLVSGAPVEVLNIAPLGDPIQVRTLGYNLSLRKSEAAEVRVVVV